MSEMTSRYASIRGKEPYAGEVRIPDFPKGFKWVSQGAGEGAMDRLHEGLKFISTYNSSYGTWSAMHNEDGVFLTLIVTDGPTKGRRYYIAAPVCCYAIDDEDVVTESETLVMD